MIAIGAVNAEFKLIKTPQSPFSIPAGYKNLFQVDGLVQQLHMILQTKSMAASGGKLTRTQPVHPQADGNNDQQNKKKRVHILSILKVFLTKP